MKYALLIYEDERVFGAEKNSPAMQDIVARHMAFTRDLGPSYTGGAGLKGTTAATTVRTSGGAKSVHDGPFAETKEQLGGFYLVDAADLDAAIVIAKNVPIAKDGAIEIRPLLGMG